MRPAGIAARVVVGAARAQGCRAVLSSGWVGLAPFDDRDDCIAVGDVDHRALFRRVAAVVHTAARERRPPPLSPVRRK